MLTNAQTAAPRPSRTTGAAPQAAQFHPLSIIKMFWKHKLQVFLLWLSICAIAVGVVYRMPSVYEASTTIIVDSQKIPDKFVTPTVNSEVEDRIATLKKEILRPTNLLEIIKRFNLYQDLRKTAPEEEVIDTMAKDTKVIPERGWTRDRPGAFTVFYQGSDPRVAAQVADAIAALFVKSNLEKRQQHAESTEQFLSTELQQAKASLDQQEVAVSQYKLAHNGELPEQEASLGSALSRLQLELQGNQDAINRAQQNRVMLENSISAAESSISSLVAMAEQSTPSRSAGNGQVFAGNGAGADPIPQKPSEVLQARLDMLLVRYREDHPEVKRLRAEIAQQRDIESKAAQAAQPGGRGPKPAAQAQGAESQKAPIALPNAVAADQLIREKERLASLKSQLILANREMEFRSAERQTILKNIQTYEKRLEMLPVREQQMAKLTRDYEISKENYRVLLNNQNAAAMAAEMEKNQQGEKFTQLEAARIPEIPVKPKRPLLITAGCLLGLLISLATAAGRETRQGVLLGEWELPSDVVVMGRVPWIEIQLDDTSSTGGWARRQRLRRVWQLALVSSAVISLACGIAAVYLGWINI